MLLFLSPISSAVACFVLVLTSVAGLPICDDRCARGNRTQIYLQRSNGTCVRRCIQSKFVPKGYGCGPCPVYDSSRYNTGLALAKVPKEHRSAFINAAARWERVIMGDLPALKVKPLRKISQCSPYLPLVIDDIFICAEFIYMDGPGKILGGAVVEYGRIAEALPLIANMKFDSADIDYLIDEGTLDGTIMHEMGHAYGIYNMFWQLHGLQDPSTCQYALRSNATKEWQTLTGCNNAIPVELGGETGTVCTHWDDDCLQTEMMTGYVDGGMELSRMTVGSLQDLGYNVSYSNADPFGISMVSPSCISNCKNGRKLGASRRPSGGRNNHRSLQTEARLSAIAYGKNMLEENAAQGPPLSVQKKNHSYTYMADQMVTILYRESDGRIHSIAVEK